MRATPTTVLRYGFPVVIAFWMVVLVRWVFL
jgi:hypothetical protein